MNNEYSQFEDGVVDEYTKEPESAAVTLSDYPDTTITYSGDYLSEDFKELAESPDKPGAPYYDETLNFLEQQWRKTNSEIGSIQTKVFKLKDQENVKERELETIKNILVEEFRARDVINPQTGEPIDEPFSEPKEDEDEGETWEPDPEGSYTV